MGIKFSSQKKKRFRETANKLGEPEHIGRSQKSIDEVLTDFDGTELHFLPFAERKAQMEEWLRDIQEHNRERLRREMLTDLHTFILNNVLLCVQFYANFDSAMLESREFKKSTEAKMNAKLSPMSDDGMILGERKCLLVHGMGHQLVQNYIYRDDGYLQKKKSQEKAANEGRKRQVTIAAVPEKNTSMGLSDLDEPRSTFTCDSILPFEFILTWENLEVYKDSEWDNLKEFQFTKGSPGICRVCLEETDDKNKIPRGFVRVRVVDTPVSLRPLPPIPVHLDNGSNSASGSLDYAAPSFASTAERSERTDDMHFDQDEAVQELRSESDFSTTGTGSSSESDSGTDSDVPHNDYSTAFRNGTDFLSELRHRVETNANGEKILQNYISNSIPKSSSIPNPKPLSEVESDEELSESSEEESDPRPYFQSQPHYEVKLPTFLRKPIDTNSGRMIGVIPQKYQDVVNESEARKHIVHKPIPPISHITLEKPKKFVKPVPVEPPKPKVKTTPVSEPPKQKTKEPPQVTGPPKSKIEVSPPSSPPISKKPTPVSQKSAPMFEKNRLFLSRNSIMLHSSPLDRKRKIKSLSNLAPPKAPPPPPIHEKSPSSGYDSLTPPQNVLARSRSNSTSVNSDDISYKWRQKELKRLWQFMPKRRTKASEPLSTSCFQKIQIEIDSEDDDILEEDPDDHSGSGSDSEVSSTNEKSKNLSEPKFEDRTYLNSVGFSADFCSEFKQVGSQLGLDDGPLRSAVILGTTIRCALTQQMEVEHEQPQPSTSQNGGAGVRKTVKMKPQELVSKLYTFTPSLYSKNWPQKPLLWWKRRMMREAWDGTEKWPTRDQVEEIEAGGCHLIPLGNRSIHSTQTENVQQTLVWSVAFPRAENVLLDSFRHVQWRCLTFAALVFRTFVAPLGPLGVGLEHIRNIMYFMCHEEFLSWNFEQPALHLKAVLDRLYDCLGRGDMPSFFVVGHNMFKNIPTQNLRKVQAYLSRVRNNLTFHAIYMIRNLVQVNADFYPMPKDDFKKLYDYMTVSEKHILYIVNPVLYKGITTEDLKKEANEKKRKRREKQKINQALLMNGELIDTAYGNAVNGVPKFRPIDHEQRKLRRKRERWTEKQRKIKEYEEEQRRLAAEAEKLPQERRNSIDLDEKPFKQRQFSALRLGLVLRYFIKHFIKMAAKSYQFKTYAQASMYTQHVENLLSLLYELPMEADSAEFEKLQEDAKALREMIGVRMLDYIQEKMSLAGTGGVDTGNTSKVFDHIAAIISSPPHANSGIFSNNWELRTLPTPEMSMRSARSLGHLESSVRNSAFSRQMNLNNNYMAKSLASISISSSTRTRDEVGFSTAGFGFGSAAYSDFNLSHSGQGFYNQRRNPEIKWNSNPNMQSSSRIRSQMESDNVTFGTPTYDY